MANIKSAIKRVKLSEERNLRNTSFKSDVRTAVKKAEAAILNNDVVAKESVAVAAKKLDKAASKGLIHKNNVARQKSRLMKKANNMNA